jgi:hypothetical protein
VDLAAPIRPDALAIKMPPTLNPGPAIVRQTAIIHGTATLTENMTWVGGSDGVCISLTPLPPPSMKATVPDHESLYAILSSARHTISVDPKMAAQVQANPSPNAVHLLR